MEKFKLAHHRICSWICSAENKQKPKDEVIMQNIRACYEHFDEDQLSIIRAKIKKVFLPHFRRESARYRSQSTLKNYAITFLRNIFVVDLKSNKTSSEGGPRKPTLRRSARKNLRVCVGRPLVPLDHASRRTRYRRGQVSNTEATKNLRKKSKVAAKKRVQVRRRNYSDEFLQKSLAAYMDGDMTRDKWNKLRQHNATIFENGSYPPYKKIAAAKSMCYPDKIDATIEGATVELQSLLDHTVSRIFLLIPKDILARFDGKLLELQLKYGMDGCSSNSVYQQKQEKNEQQAVGSNKEINEDEQCKEDEECDEDSDLEENVDNQAQKQNEDSNKVDFSSVFCVSCVPLQLQCCDQVLWDNERPSSLRLCRPIQFIFMKESKANIVKEHLIYKEKIDRLEVKEIKIDNMSFRVKYTLEFTMMDGKLCNAITNQKSSGSCNICFAKPKEMNNLSLIMKKKIHEEFLCYGLSTLHCKIRFMECLLNIAYNMDFKKNTKRGFHAQRAERKKQIQMALRKNLGIIVDIVKQGTGTTNTGNTARKFFKNYQVVAKILNVDENLVERFSVILQVISCNRQIDYEAFKKYANDTVNLFVKLYNWKFMPPTVHKVLIHGWEIIKFFGGHIGKFNEEAQEANNKAFREARANKSRLCSAEKNHIDIIHYLLIASDPVISSLRIQKKEEILELSEQAKLLLCKEETKK